MNPRGGYTLIEVLVASSLLALILTMLFTTWSMMQRASATQQTLREGRQQARIMLETLVEHVQDAVVIWPGTNTVNGHAYQVPSAGVAPPAQGTDLLYAGPEANAGGTIQAGRLTYTVEGVYTQPMSPSDPLNPDDVDVVWERFPGAVPTHPDEPASIDLGTMSPAMAGYSKRVFHPYLVKGNWLAVLSPPRAVYIDVTMVRVTQQGTVQSEHVTTEATMRNGH